jgi:AraC-like DNA-binding protein
MRSLRRARACFVCLPSLNGKWLVRGQTLDELLNGWAASVETWFERHHVIPPALRARRLLHGHLPAPFSLDSLARAVGCSRTTLIQQFTAAVGMTPSEYGTRLRVREGLRRLGDSSEAVEDAARRAGYSSVNKLYRRVRQYTGLTPSQVRELGP